MPFNKTYFEKLSEYRQKYTQVFSCGGVTVTIRMNDQQEYNVERILGCGEDLLTFAFYSKEKSRKLHQKAAERTGEPKAWPALTVPYETIFSVEFNPGRVVGLEGLGFKG